MNNMFPSNVKKRQQQLLTYLLWRLKNVFKGTEQQLEYTKHYVSAL